MFHPLPRIVVLAVVVLTIPFTATLGADAETRVDLSADGPTSSIVTTDRESPRPSDLERPPIPDGQRGATVLWHRHFDDPIYTSTGISETSGLVIAGTYWNAPKHVEATPILGDGTEDWTSGGNHFFVDASRQGNVIAAVDFNDNDSTATISQWGPDSPIPLWSYEVHPCRSLVYQGWATRKPICVSDDGSTIAVGIVMYRPEGQRGNLFIFDAGIGTPIVDYDLPDGNIVATEMTPDGAFIALAGWPTIYVFDRYGQSLRWSGPIYSGNDALAISGDGNYLAWGWSNFYLREWNGTSYSPVWTYNPPGSIYAGQCAFSADESSLAVTWDSGNAYPSQVTVDLYELPSLSLLWSYDYQGAPSNHVDIPSQIRFSPDGEHLAIASWGGDFPEIHVFERSTPEPVFTLDSPGSMFDIDITTTPGGGAHVTACGKNVHAGTGGRGGDLYAIEIPGDPSGIDAAAHRFDASFVLDPVFPNPARTQTRIRYVIDRPGFVRLSVHDSRGRLVKLLSDHHHEGGVYSVVWSGEDETRRSLPAGVYLVRLVTREIIKTGKLLRLE